jgi:hypothetical protein
MRVGGSTHSPHFQTAQQASETEPAFGGLFAER